MERLQFAVFKGFMCNASDAFLNNAKFYAIFRFDLGVIIISISEIFLNFAPDKPSLVKR